MRTPLPKLFVIALPLLGVFLYFSHRAAAETAGHVVISEVMIGRSGNTTDEFIELYNPSNSSIDLNGFRLMRMTKSQDFSEASDVISNINLTIHSKGYLLLANPNYLGQVAADATYSANLAADNSIFIDQGEGSEVIDLVGWGDSETVEGTPAAALSNNGKSIERKATSLSVKNSMIPGGLDALEGNGEDSQNNFADFVTRELPDPQSSNSPLESIGDADYTTLVSLNGLQEVPVSTSSATGKATVEVNLANLRVNYALSYQGLVGALQMMHVHGMAPVGANAPALHTIPAALPTNGYWSYNANQLNDILAGLTYINIHTTAYPDGEIRGQIQFANVTPPPSGEPTPTLQPSPTPDPTPTPTIVPTTTPEPTTTPVPTATPTPTDIPTPTPTSELTPTPTVDPTPTTQPTPTPTMEPTNTPTPEPTVTPTPPVEPTYTPMPTPTLTPSPTPTPLRQFSFLNVTCTRHYNSFSFFGRVVRMPYIVCLPR